LLVTDYREQYTVRQYGDVVCSVLWIRKADTEHMFHWSPVL